MSIKEKHIKDDNEYVREKKELILSEKQEGLIELPFKRFIGLLHMEDWRKGAFCMEDPVSIEVEKKYDREWSVVECGGFQNYVSGNNWECDWNRPISSSDESQ